MKKLKEMKLDEEAVFTDKEIEMLHRILKSLLAPEANERYKQMLDKSPMIEIAKMFKDKITDPEFKQMIDGTISDMKRKAEDDMIQHRKMLVSITDKLHIYKNCLINQ